HFMLASVCSNDWILALHQTLLILLIAGKWLLPLGAADILEFTNETLSDTYHNSVWAWSMLQFPLHLPVVNSKPESDGDLSTEKKLRRNSTDIWNIMEALFFQDSPFLVVRLTVMILFETIHQMLVFFAIKNSLVVILNLYRFFVIWHDYRASRPENSAAFPFDRSRFRGNNEWKNSALICLPSCWTGQVKKKRKKKMNGRTKSNKTA
uniref:Uncharacterized protein n=1 Tax=Oryzias latipes TaxID=8090 RepID=A0A3P9I9R7_ORYLA